MFIKRVVAQGFKTFAKRTEFIFETGITAVVGPNGSGKSNIVDAVRWCLGEQSFSLLRSKKTSDVIFSGSDKRARLGMAEVTLTLDNSRGQVPLAFTEIEITRRAYRDGDNEYLLNGKRVRLQDITDLLAHTGLSRRTYAVIGQGLIDRVLNLAPEERRSLFEEAAGITGYQQKRVTTLHRLEATQQNLTRVHDILTELTPRLKYLHRQAERAREYERIATDLRSMLRDWYGYRWHTTLRALEEQGRHEAGLRAIVTQRQQGLATLEAELTTGRAEETALRTRLADLHQISSIRHQAAEQSSREVAVATERLHQLRTRYAEAQQELTALQAEQQGVMAHTAAFAQAREEAQRLLNERQAAVRTAQSAVDARQQERTGLQQEVDKARRRLQQQQAQRIDLASRQQQIRERISTIEQESAKQQTIQSTAAQEVSKVQAELQRMEEERSSLEATLETARTALTDLQATVRQQQSELDTSNQARQNAARVVDRLQTRLDLLKRLHDEGAGYASGVRAVLQASSGRDAQALQGILGAVATLLHVPAQLDKAIETALGGALQNIVTTTWAETQAAIEFLKRSGRGRATFLPLDRLQVPSTIPAPRAPGLLGNAVDLVDYDERAAAALQQLLNRVWVAEDLPAARRALDNYRNNLRPTVVTIDGEIIRPGGAVTGGNDANRRDDSILARERELRELPAQVAQAEREHQAEQQRCTTLQQTIATMRQEVSATELRLAELSRQERQQQQSVETLRRQADRAQQTLRWHDEQQAARQEQLTALTTQRATLAGQLEQGQAAEAAAQAQLTAAEAAVEAAGTNELLQALADLRAAAVEAQAQLRNQETLIENQQRTLQRLVQQEQARTETVQRLDQDITALQTRLAEQSTIEAQVRGQLDELRQQIEPLEQQVAQLEQAHRHREEKLRATQQALRKDESTWNNARLQLQRTEDALHQLQHEIEQDLGLVLVEQSDSLAYQPPLPWDAVVEQLPVLESIPDGFAEEVRETRARLSRLTNVNPEALREYDEAAERHTFLTNQSADLEGAIADMRRVIKELDALMESALQRTFAAVSEQFVYFFQRLFNGGTAQLILTTPEDITNTGIEIIARPPGKRPQSLALLSGGERTLAACALIFAILRVSPTPFCVLDEVDAALDEANVDRFRLTVESLSDNTQFIIVTHNRRTLEGASTIYGVTMGNDGISRVISLRLEGDQIVQHNSNNGQDDADLKQIEELVKM